MKILKIISSFIKTTWFLFVDLLTDRPQIEGGVRKISLGRVCFLILFGLSISIWMGGADIAANMLIVLASLLTYVFGSQITGTFKALRGINNEPTGRPETPSGVVVVEPEEHGD